MNGILSNLRELLRKQDRRKLYPLFALVLFMAIVDTLGVASIMPFMALLADPGVLETNQYLAAIYEYLGFQSTRSFLIFAGGVTLGLLVGSVALRALTLWVQLRFTHFQSHIVATRMVRFYLRQPYEWFLSHNSSGMAANVLSEVTSAFQGVIYPLMLLFVNAIVATLLIGLLLVVDPWLAVTSTFALGGVYLGVFLLARRFMTRMGTVRVEANRGRHMAIYEAFQGIKDIKITGMEEGFLGRFCTHSERTARAGVSSALVSEMPSFAMQAVVFGGMLIALLYLIMTRGSLPEAIPIISLFAVAGYRLLPTLQNTYKNLVTVRYNLPALAILSRDLRQFELNSPDEQPTDRDDPAGEPIRLTRALELRGIDFRYPGSEHEALQCLSLVIPAQSVTAFVGTTGSGKTTAVDVILGLLRPKQGHLLVDDMPVRASNVRVWQRAIGYVPQNIFLSDDTIAANIAFGVAPDEIDRKAVENAGRLARLHEFISQELPNGYDTQIGERGVRLSGGQRQRIGIARALYHDPEVLILDEATSALDNVTEQQVMDAILHLDRRRTVIMIAHRLSTVRNCDCIFLLDRGKVIASGTYDELITSSKPFRAMALQSPD